MLPTSTRSTRSIGAPATSQWKVTSDGLPVSQADVTYLVQNVLKTSYADANLDCKVDFADFQTLLYDWMGHYGWAGGDFNGNGVVDFGDFQILLDNWNPMGTGLGPPPAISSALAPAVVSVGTSLAAADSRLAPAEDLAALQTTSSSVAAAVVGVLVVPSPLAAAGSPETATVAAQPLLCDPAAADATDAQNASGTALLTPLSAPLAS